MAKPQKNPACKSRVPPAIIAVNRLREAPEAIVGEDRSREGKKKATTVYIVVAESCPVKQVLHQAGFCVFFARRRATNHPPNPVMPSKASEAGSGLAEIFAPGPDLTNCPNAAGDV